MCMRHTRRWLALGAGLVVFCALATPALPAQTDCEKGADSMRAVPPQGISPQEIIEKFTARESLFKAQRKNYTFTQDVTIQTLRPMLSAKPGVDGEYRQVIEVSFDEHGKRLERVTFAPQTSLLRITLTPEDLEDIRERSSFALGTEDLPVYTVRYAGRQHVDQLETYVFEVAPKTIEHGQHYFQGRIWVEQADLVVVKTCGKTVPDVIHVKKGRRTAENIHPTFVTYREEIDGRYWFPTYSRSDDTLNFSTGSVHIRETIKFLNYQASASKAQAVRGEAMTEKSK